MDGRIDPRQAVVGFVAIVAGVFVALAADTWWQDREEGEIERENLVLLGRELAAIDSTLARVIRIDSATTATGFALNIEDYRIPTGAARRRLAEPGPVLRADSELHIGLSDLDAEIATTQDLIRMLTGTTLQDIDGFFTSMSRASAAGTMDGAAAILAEDPTVSACRPVWLPALQDRDGIHRRLRDLVADVRESLEGAIGD